MRREHIRACPLWRKQHPRNDCVFVNTNPGLQGMQGLEIAQVLAFFSFRFETQTYPCAVIRWFKKLDTAADENTGMWIVQPGHNEDGDRNIAVIHIGTIFRAAHLIPVYGSNFIKDDITYYNAYDSFQSFYVNKYADHHAF
ncbi:hypothetical protein BJ138DRAFT_976095, partial [Hygrophoropsis aurantiaca]